MSAVLEKDMRSSAAKSSVSVGKGSRVGAMVNVTVKVVNSHCSIAPESIPKRWRRQRRCRPGGRCVESIVL